MKKLPLRMRMSVITSLCLSISCIVMVLALFWLADTQVVQYIEMEITDVSSDVVDEIEEKLTSGYWWEDELLVEGAEEALTEVASQGLIEFYIIGRSILAIIVILGSVMAWVVSGWSIAPVKKLSMQIDHIDEQRLSAHIDDFSAGDEL